MKNLANELRPKTLDDIIGQKSVVELLKELPGTEFTQVLYFLVNQAPARHQQQLH